VSISLKPYSEGFGNIFERLSVKECTQNWACCGYTDYPIRCDYLLEPKVPGNLCINGIIGRFRDRLSRRIRFSEMKSGSNFR